MIKKFNDFLNEDFTQKGNKELSMIFNFLKISGGILVFMGGNSDDILKFVPSLMNEFSSNFNEGIYSLGIDLNENNIEELTKEKLDSIQRSRGHNSCVIVNIENSDSEFTNDLYIKSSMKVYIKDIEMD